MKGELPAYKASCNCTSFTCQRETQEKNELGVVYGLPSRIDTSRGIIILASIFGTLVH